MRLIHADLEHVTAVQCPAGHPAVLACRPVRRVNGGLEPFPTTHWLACDALDRVAAEAERLGWIARVEAAIAADPAFAAAVAADHRACAAERIARLEPEERAELESLSRFDDVASRGIGGVRDFATVKCLHAQVAWHLAHSASGGGAVGRFLEAAGFVLAPCPARGNSAP